MTNKINGIDVSECLNSVVAADKTIYCNQKLDFYGTPVYKCEENSNCYFKQLKRLQQELDIKEKMLDKFMIGSGETLEKLQQENEELKEKNAILILANSGIEEKNEQLNERVKTFTKPKYYYKGLQKTEEEKDKYKQALENIKNITEKLITELPEYNSCYYKDECGDNCTPKKQSKVEYCCYENADKILTIISEVLKCQH